MGETGGKVEGGEEEEEERELEEETMAEMVLEMFTQWRSTISSCFLQNSNGINNIVVLGEIQGPPPEKPLHLQQRLFMVL